MAAAEEKGSGSVEVRRIRELKKQIWRDPGDQFSPADMKIPMQSSGLVGEGEIGAASTEARPRDRRLAPLYRAGLICLFVISTLVSGRLLVWYWSQGPYATDLRIFLSGVELMRNGQGRELYQFAAEEAVQNRLFPDTKEAGYLSYNHLAYELLLYWPLARLPYRAALMTWGAINAGFLLLIAWLLKPFTKALREFSGIPILLWMIAFYPVLYVLGEGQDSIVTLLLIVLSLWLMEDRREFISGFTLGLVLFKIHLSLGIAFFVFLVPRKWRGVAGFATSAILMTGISMVMVGPSFVRDYLHIIRLQESTTPWGFIPRFMPNYRGILEWTLIRWLDMGSLLLLIFVLSLGTIGTTWIALRVRDRTAATALYAAAIPTALLVSYHLHVQDLSLAILPMLVLLDSCVRGEFGPVWARILILSLAGFYLFGAASGVVHYLVFHAALLVFPLILLWLASVGGAVSGRMQPAGGRIFQQS